MIYWWFSTNTNLRQKSCFRIYTWNELKKIKNQVANNKIILLYLTKKFFLLYLHFFFFYFSWWYLFLLKCTLLWYLSLLLYIYINFKYHKRCLFYHIDMRTPLKNLTINIIYISLLQLCKCINKCQSNLNLVVKNK